MAPDDVPLPLLERYATGECTPEDLAALEAWVDGQPERRLFLRRFQLLFAQPPNRESPAAFSPTEIEQAWSRLADRMSAEADKERVRSMWRRRVVTVIAACAAVAIAAWLLVTRR